MRASLLLSLLLFPLPLRASEPPPTVLVLAPSGLTYDDLHPEGGTLPEVAALADAGSAALLNAAVSGEATEAAALLSIGAGERMAAPEHGGPRFVEEGTARSAAQMAREFYPLRSDARSAKKIALRYRQRFGEEVTAAAAAVHLGLPSLRNAQPSPSRAAQVGALGDALARAGKRVVVQADWRTALLGMDSRGRVATSDRPVIGLLPQGDVFIAYTKDKAALNTLARAMLPLATRGAANILVLAAAPPSEKGKWARLGFVVAAGPAFPSKTLLFSSTTRTRGLVANIDIAPTLLALHKAGTLPGGTGRPVRAFSRPDTWGALRALERQATGTSRAIVPVSIGYGVFAIGSALLAIAALWRQNLLLSRGVRFALLTAAATLLALLPVGVIAPLAPWQYGLLVAGISVGLATAAQATGAATKINPFALLYCATAAVIIADAFLGSPLVARSLLSGYFLSGIRFYGIGNEYMGILVGCALAGPALLHHPPSLPVKILQAVLAVGALLALGLPQLGADAGGLLGATVAFVVAIFAGRHARLHLRHIALAFLIAFVLVGAMAALDRLRPPDTRSHVGAAIATGQQSGAGALMEIAARKIAMNVALTLTPYTAAAVAGLLPVWLLLGRGKTGEQARGALAARPALARMLPAAGWGALTALVFNDSGIVAALLLLAPPTVAVLQAMLHDLTVSG